MGEGPFQSLCPTSDQIKSEVEAAGPSAKPTHLEASGAPWGASTLAGSPVHPPRKRKCADMLAVLEGPLWGWDYVVNREIN